MSPGWGSLVGRALACELKGHWISSQFGACAWAAGRAHSWGVREATDGCFPLS